MYDSFVKIFCRVLRVLHCFVVSSFTVLFHQTSQHCWSGDFHAIQIHSNDSQNTEDGQVKPSDGNISAT